MASFNSLEEIFADIEKNIGSALQETGNEISVKMQSIIASQVYGGYTPSVYKRTGRLMSSAKIINISSTHLTVGIEEAYDVGFTGSASMSEIIDMFTSGVIYKAGNLDEDDGLPGYDYRPPIPLAPMLTAELNKAEQTFISKLKAKIPLK